jgi:C_GCAxxG_C_C family probable redox protein
MTDDLVEQASRKAMDAERQFWGCSQAVLGSLQETFHIGDNESFRAGTILSAGVARRGETCGALIGALMALGVACGRNQMSDREAYNKAMDHAQGVVDAFKAGIQDRYNLPEPLQTTLCPDIQTRLYGRSFDFTDPAERKAFNDGGGHNPSGCPMVCAIAAEAAARKILDLRQNA